MSLTWKDGVTTLLAVVVMGVYYAMTSHAIRIPVIGGSYRWAIMAVALLGIGMCAFSGGANTTGGMNSMIAFAGMLGVAALAIIIYGLITGTQLAFMLLTGVIISLWVISTVRHLIQK